MSSHQLGLLLLGLGAGIAALGLVVMTGALHWFGRLPGDIRIEREGLRVYIPWVSMLLLSAVISAVAWVVRRLARS